MKNNTKKNIKEKNSNFLNNQNYILGNYEKKKILNKFFINKNTNIFFNILTKINIFFNSKFIFTLYYIIFLFLIFPLYSLNFLLFILLIIIGFILFVAFYFIANKNKTKINNFYTFVFGNTINIPLYITKIILLILIINKIIYYINNYINDENVKYIIGIILLIIFIFLSFVKINNIIGIILFIPYIIIYYIFSFINTFFIKGIKGYNIIKKYIYSKNLEDYYINNKKIENKKNIIYRI